MKILLSAFKPFNNSLNNYSEEVLKNIDDVEKIVLDVLYDKSYETLSNNYNLDEYDLIIALGEARSRQVLTIEVQAKNISSCSLKDNSGVLKQNEKIIANGEEIINTKVDIKKYENIIEFSYDAGKFVCNNIYYHLLYNYPNKSLFIHIPECNNDNNNYIKHANVIKEIIKKFSN